MKKERGWPKKGEREEDGMNEGISEGNAERE